VILCIQGSMTYTESSLKSLSLNDHIRPYVDYYNIQRLRLAANIAFEDKKELKMGLLRLFRSVKYLKIDRMKYLHSLLNQQKKFIDLMANQIHLLKILEPTDWWFW
jgi:hypothetical protein